MGKVSQWESQIDGLTYAFEHEKIKGKHMLTVNGNPMEIKGGFNSGLLGFDEPFMLDGREARLVIEGKKPDIVINGVYLQSGKQHRPRPAWVIAFAVLCGVLIIVGGALGALIGICGAALCVLASKASISTVVRVILCIVITMSTWLVWFLLASFITSLL